MARGGENNRESVIERDWRVLILSLFLACFAWLVYNMSKEDYADAFFLLTIETDMPGYSSQSTAREELPVRGKASGFYKVRNTLKSNNVTAVTINVRASLLEPVAGQEDIFALETSDIIKQLDDALTTDFRVEFLERDKLTFHFEPQEFVTVPVEPQLSVSFEDQYMQTGDISLWPDSVSVYGPRSDLEHITSIKTRVVYLSDVDRTVEGLAYLEPVKGVRLGTDRINFTLPVDRYVEISEMVPVAARNVPHGMSLIILPPRVKVICRVPFRSREELATGMKLFVDYEDLVSSRGTKVIPHLETDEVVYRYEFDPRVVECLIQE